LSEHRRDDRVHADARQQPRSVRGYYRRQAAKAHCSCGPKTIANLIPRGAACARRTRPPRWPRRWRPSRRRQASPANPEER
jgi:hypothetical protein